MSNSTESRQIDGYIRKWVEMGRTRIEVVCPFCGCHLIAYVWSLAGSGKRCENKKCRAMMDSSGTFTRDVTKR